MSRILLPASAVSSFAVFSTEDRESVCVVWVNGLPFFFVLIGFGVFPKEVYYDRENNQYKKNESYDKTNNFHCDHPLWGHCNDHKIKRQGKKILQKVAIT